MSLVAVGRLADLRLAVSVFRQHPAWCSSKVAAFDALVPTPLILRGAFAASAWECAFSGSASEVAAWCASGDEHASIMVAIGTALRLTPCYPGALDNPVFRPTDARASLVRDAFFSGPAEGAWADASARHTLRYVIELEVALSMATAYCYRADPERAQSMEAWLRVAADEE
jgi:hypothetical protein